MEAICSELEKRNTVESALDRISNLPAKVKEMGVSGTCLFFTWCCDSFSKNTCILVSVLREGAVVLAEGVGRLFLCSACIVLAVEEEDEEKGEPRLSFVSLLDFKPTPPVVLSSAESAAAFDLQTSRGSTAVQVKTVEERISWMQVERSKNCYGVLIFCVSLSKLPSTPICASLLRSTCFPRARSRLLWPTLPRAACVLPR